MTMFLCTVRVRSVESCLCLFLHTKKRENHEQEQGPVRCKGINPINFSFSQTHRAPPSHSPSVNTTSSPSFSQKKNVGSRNLFTSLLIPFFRTLVIVLFTFFS